LSGVVNYQVLIQDNTEDIIFLHRIEQGGANKSYGIAIAKLAGFPSDVLELAKRALIHYEQKKSQLSFLETLSPNDNQIQETSSEPEQYNNLLQDIHSYNLNDITPLQAMSILDELQKNNPL